MEWQQIISVQLTILFHGNLAVFHDSIYFFTVEKTFPIIITEKLAERLYCLWSNHCPKPVLIFLKRGRVNETVAKQESTIAKLALPRIFVEKKITRTNST